MSGLSDLDGLVATPPDWFKAALAVPRTEHVVPCDGGTLHGFSWGDPKNPSVLFTHGMMAHARCWAFIAPLLAEHFHLAAFDISGMGDSSWHDAYTHEQRAAEALVFANALEMERPQLVCHSFGGSVGLSAVERYPESFSSLIICDMTMLRPEDLADFAKSRVENPGFAKVRTSNKVYENLADALARYRLAPAQPCENEYLFEYMAYHSLKRLEGGYVWKFDPKILSPDRLKDTQWWSSLSTRFAGLTLPKAIVHGERSELFTPPIAQYMRELTEHRVPIVAIEQAYHHVMLDQPIALAATLNALLQSLPAKLSR